MLFLSAMNFQFDCELLFAKGGGGVVFVGGWEMKIFSTLFRDFGKNMVGKRYFQH